MNQNNKDEINIENFSFEKEVLKYEGLEPKGWNILVRLYIPPNKTNNGLYLPTSVTDEHEYKSCVGLVLKKAKGVYKDDRYKLTGNWCEVGDWVVFPRHSGYPLNYKDIPIYILKEDSIDLIINNPKDIKR